MRASPKTGIASIFSFKIASRPVISQTKFRQEYRYTIVSASIELHIIPSLISRSLAAISFLKISSRSYEVKLFTEQWILSRKCEYALTQSTCQHYQKSLQVKPVATGEKMTALFPLEVVKEGLCAGSCFKIMTVLFLFTNSDVPWCKSSKLRTNFSLLNKTARH